MERNRSFTRVIAHERSFWSALLESSLFTFFILILSFVFHHTDPFFIDGPIPWLLLMPILFGLLYGLGFALVSLGIIILGLFVFGIMHLSNVEILSFRLKEFLFGGLLFTFSSGLFGSYFRKKIASIEYLNQYIFDHLDSLSRTYYMTRISYERLEHTYMTKPTTLRDIFYLLNQKALIDVSSQGLTPEYGKQLLLILSQFLSLDEAQIIQIKIKGKDGLSFKPLALVGHPFSVDAEDILVRSALNQHMTAYIAVNSLKEAEQSQYLVVIPMLLSDESLIGLLIIKKMPFWGLTHDNLEKVSALMAYACNQYHLIQTSREFLHFYPECPIDFAAAFYKLVFMKKAFGLNSSLVAIVVPEQSNAEFIIIGLEHQQRGLDYSWRISKENRLILIGLLSFADASSVEGYIVRINNWLKLEFDIDMTGKKNRRGIFYRVHELTNDAPEANMRCLLESLG